MRLNLWLAQAETERMLATALRGVVIAFACWALAAVYGLWSTRTALAASQSAVASQSRKISDVVRDIPRKRAEAARSVRVRVASPESAASAELTDELSRLAQAAGADIAGVRIEDAGQAKAAAPTAPATADAAPAASAPVTAGDGWDQETFECNVAGEYDALMRFLNALAASRLVLDISAVEMTQAGVRPDKNVPRLEMKLTGTVSERPGKS